MKDKCPNCGMPLGTGDTPGQECFHCKRASRVRVRHLVMVPVEERDALRQLLQAERKARANDEDTRMAEIDRQRLALGAVTRRAEKAKAALDDLGAATEDMLAVACPECRRSGQWERCRLAAEAAKD